MQAALLDLVERTIGRLTELAAAHAARSEAEASRADGAAGFRRGHRGRAAAAVPVRLRAVVKRALDTLLKLRRGGRGQERSAGGEEDRGPAIPSVRDEATSSDIAPTPVQNEATAPVAAADPVQDEAIAPAVAQPPVQNEAIVPAVAPTPVQNEAIVPAVAQPPVQDEATDPAVDRPGPSVEAVAPTGDTSRMAPPSGPASLNGATETVKPAINGPSPGLPEIGSRHSLRGPQDASAIETV